MIVRIKDFFEEIWIVVNGMYRIMVLKGDIFEIRVFGMFIKDIMVLDFRKIYIFLELDGELLEIIRILVKKGEKEIVNIVFGEKKKVVVGYFMRNIISREEI